jgi:uncharacterized protein YecE (DUF72 family)
MAQAADTKVVTREQRLPLGASRSSCGSKNCDVYVYVYFDNDQKSAAPMDALALLRLLAC